MSEAEKPFLAIDLGASSGRAVVGRLAGGRLELAELHRFENRAVRLKDTLYWDFLHLWSNVLAALSRCAASGHRELAGIGVDSWNLDFGLLDRDGALLGNPVSYRDQGAASAGAEIAARIGETELYRETGMPVFPASGLARLVRLLAGPSPALLDLAGLYLPIPALVRYFLTGEAAVEETISWGSQLVDLRTRSWSERLIEALRIPARILPPPVPPATVAGALSRPVAQAAGLAACPVVAVAEHDTASAAFTASVLQPHAAVLSAGTWSILGVLVDQPVLSREAREGGFMNELACEGLFLARNTMGFYLQEELIHSLRARGMERDYRALAEMAQRSPAGALRIDPDDPLFYAPGNLQRALEEYCGRTGQPATSDPGTIVRALYEGLAASYAAGLEELGRLTGRRPARMVMVGGGVRNRWFCQLVAEACGLPVLAGPPEATVIGNLCLQALALGRMDRESLQSVLRESFPVQRHGPAACAP